MAFKLLHSIKKEPRIVEWCKTLDLVAMVSSGGSLHVYRSLKMQRLFGAPAASLGGGVTCLEWHPSGKTLAAGLQDGRVLLFDIETVSTFIWITSALRLCGLIAC